jgi:hypothetical protein
MELTAKVIQVLPLQTGTSKNGDWKKQDIIVETTDQYPKKVCVSIWGDKINNTQLSIGSMLNIAFNLESREYNGRWYTVVKAWKIDVVEEQANTPPPINEHIPPVDLNQDEDDEDLPF